MKKCTSLSQKAWYKATRKRTSPEEYSISWALRGRQSHKFQFLRINCLTSTWVWEVFVNSGEESKDNTPALKKRAHSYTHLLINDGDPKQLE